MSFNESTNNADAKDDSFAFIQLTDDEYSTLRQKCLESLSLSYGRTAFSLIINRQRNTEYGLELQRDQFFGLVDLIHCFFDSIQKSEPLDIKPAKLVMIMSQSLYVKKVSVMDNLDEQERRDLVDSENDNNGNSQFLPKKNKLFIVDRIKNHQIWKNDKFWKEAYCDSVQQEIMKYPAVKKWHSEPEQQEAERREEQIIFSQLAAWTHNMKEFGIENEKIIKFLDSRGLKAESVEVLKATLQLNDEQNAYNNNDDEKVNNDEMENADNNAKVEVVDDNVKSSTNDMETVSASITPTSSVGLP